MSVKKMVKYLDIVSLVMELFIITLLAFFLTFLSCGFDITKFNWKMFALTEAFNIYARAVATTYASKKETELNADVNLLNDSLMTRRKNVFRSENQNIFEEALFYYNCLKNYSKYYLKLSLKKAKDESKKRAKLDDKMKKIDALVKLLKDKQYQPFEELSKEYRLYSIRFKYPIIKQSQLWCGFSKDDREDEEHAFNLVKSSVSYAIPSMLGLALFNVMLASLLMQVNTTAEAIVQLGSYLFSIIMGCTWGFKNGKKVIANDYRLVLTNNLNVVKNLMQEANISVD